jgi:hypothetical protein
MQRGMNCNRMIYMKSISGTGLAYTRLKSWGGNAPCFHPPLVRFGRGADRARFFPAPGKSLFHPHVTIIA